MKYDCPLITEDDWAGVSETTNLEKLPTGRGAITAPVPAYEAGPWM